MLAGKACMARVEVFCSCAILGAQALHTETARMIAMQVRPVASIKAGGRVRQDLGDLDKLVESIKQNGGLLQPILVRSRSTRSEPSRWRTRRGRWGDCLVVAKAVVIPIPDTIGGDDYRRFAAMAKFGEVLLFASANLVVFLHFPTPNSKAEWRPERCRLGPLHPGRPLGDEHVR